jgi:hypothetical protein
MDFPNAPCANYTKSKSPLFAHVISP